MSPHLKCRYAVDLKDGPVDILKGITGHARPGRMCALMGASGAGKTTLLDVLAGRKTTGTIKGEIFVNGLPVIGDKAYMRTVGCVENCR